MSSQENAAEGGLRRVDDARALRAFAHPARIALLEAVAVHGPLTATEAASHIGGTPSNASYHLRTLAKYGYVAEAESSGSSGRERPWQLGMVGLSVDRDAADPAVGRAGQALHGLVAERWSARMRAFEERRAEYPQPVRDASRTGQYVLFGTPDELTAAQDAIAAVLLPFMDRATDPGRRPDGALAFEVVVTAHPFDGPDAVTSPSALGADTESRT